MIIEFPNIQRKIKKEISWIDLCAIEFFFLDFMHFAETENENIEIEWLKMALFGWAVTREKEQQQLQKSE